MTTATLKIRKKAKPIVIGPHWNGMLMTPREFDGADFEDGWRYELINGVLIVSPIPSTGEADPNDELGRWLRDYRQHHPQGTSLSLTLPERTISTGTNRRRADRCIWTGLGRSPKRSDRPSIAVEFVSWRKRDRVRDYETKRDEYMSIRIQENWVIDRFDRCMVVFSRQGTRIRRKII